MADRNKEKAYLRGEELYKVIIGDGSSDVETALGRMMMYLGFKSKLTGTRYLNTAIVHRYQRSGAARVSLTGEIYPVVAEKECSTVNRVERAIRNAIKDCADNGNLIALNDLTHSQLVEPKFSPTNGELICIIADWLRLERKKGVILDKYTE